MSEHAGKVRIQKVLAEAGVASRRSAEMMILEGLVKVNGQIVHKLPCFVEEDDEIRVDGSVVRRHGSGRKTYFLINKPKGVVCSQTDLQQRPRVYDIVPPLGGQIYCVGSLDVDATGLVLLTSDGELAEILNHPRYNVPRRYLVEVDGRVGVTTIEALKIGVIIDRRRSNPAKVKVLRRGPERTLLELELVESSGREVRPILARLGHKSRRLKRTGLGPISDVGIKIGHFRTLRSGEVTAIKRAGAAKGGPPRRR
ncbi:MAG: pseudouridine synthase [Phycisphaerae bacterium]|jgi:23S rRNA pseudouridine2605 synthase